MAHFLKFLFSLLAVGFIAFPKLNSQTTAIDWTKTDCNSNQTHLFEKLDNGQVVIQVFVHMGCIPCIIGSTYMSQIYDEFQISHPQRVLLYYMSYDNIATCQEMTDWGNTNILPSPKIVNCESEVNYYGGMGMPTIAIVGNPTHGVYYKRLGFSSSEMPVMRAAIQTALSEVGNKPNLNPNSKKPTYYHDPVNRILHVTVPLEPVSIQLFNLEGRSILKREIDWGQKPNSKVEIETDAIMSGVYLLGINTKHQFSFQKIILMP